jgi:CRP-like cAMP-binding protein
MDPNRLREIPVFSDIPDDELRTLATFASETSVAAGTTLVREGDYSYEFMAIEEGTAEVRHDDQVVATLGPGEFFGEMGVLRRGLRNATVVATAPMRLMTLTSWDLGRVPTTRERIERVLAQRAAGA